jgi:predicted RNA-binding Zn ribbon-like protein
MAKRETSGETARRTPAAVGGAIVDFLNSRPHASRPDGLDNARDAALLLRPLSPDDAPALSEDDLRLLRELRANLLAVIAPADADAAAADQAWERLSGNAAAVTFRYTFPGGGEVRLEPVAPDTLPGAIIKSVAELVLAGDWSRIKICAHPQCSAAFYDATRSRTQRWDSYEVCGNRANVAAYRTRRASAT